MDLENRSVGVLGLGVTGKAIVEFLLSKNAKVYVFDSKFNSDAALKLQERGVIVASDTPNAAILDILIVSPGVSDDHELVVEQRRLGALIYGEIDFAQELLSSCPWVRFYGITGTNGKTTVTSMVHHILKSCGKNSLALGNIGEPLISNVTQILQNESPLDIVLELSSYQVDTLKAPFLSSAVILNITPDHLDRYKTMDRYADSKLALADHVIGPQKCWIDEASYFSYAKRKGFDKFYRYGFSPEAELSSDGFQVFYKQKVEFILPLNYRGCFGHDLLNMMAAYILCKDAGLTEQLFLDGLKTFKKPPHRIEYVDEVGGVRFINDSKGTNIDAVIKALESTSGPVHLIAGGVDKGHSYKEWERYLNEKIVSLHLIGEAANLIEKELGGKVDLKIYCSLEQAVNGAFRAAKRGEAVLLSPGCASYDQFKDYKHRGEVFKNSVIRLKLESV